MKRKIVSLLLVLALVVSMFPATLFAAPGISVPLHDSTQNRTEPYGSEMFTIRIPMTALSGADLRLPAPHLGTRGVLMHVSLTGAGNDDLRFPENSQWATAWDDPNIPATAQGNWPLVVESGDTRGVFAARPADGPSTFDPARGFTGQFYRTDHQNGWIALDFNFTQDDLDALALLETYREALDDARALLAYANQWRAHAFSIYSAFAALDNAVAALLDYDDPTTETHTIPNTLRANVVSALTALVNMEILPLPVAADFDSGDAALDGILLGIFLGLATAVNGITTANTFTAQPDLTAAQMARDTPPPALVLASDVDAAWTTLQSNAQFTAITTQLGAFWDLVRNSAEVIAESPDVGNTADLGTLVEDVNEALRDLADVGGAADPFLLSENPIIATWPYIPGGAGGFLDIQIPVYRVRSGESRMDVRLHHPGGVRLVEGPLTNFVDRGVTIIPGEVVVFEHTALLNTVTIRENVAGALTRELPSQGGPRDNALAIRLTAPHGYTWERTTSPAGTGANWANHWTGQRWDDAGRVRQAMRTWGADANGNSLYNAPNFPMSPFITSPLNLLQWHCTVDGTYVLNDGRQELLILFDNLSRNPNWPAHIPAELHLSNLRLVAGAQAPATQEEVNINVHVGVVCAWGYVGWVHTDPNPEIGGVCIGTPTPRPSPPAPPGTPGPVVPGERPATPPPAEQPAVTVQNAPCFFFAGPFRFPNSLNEVMRTSAQRPSGDNGLAMRWDYAPRIPYSPSSITVARRAEAGLRLYVPADLVEFRSGSVDNWLPDNNGIFRTGQTGWLRVYEEVANALSLTPGHPITFTFPEGVQVVGVEYTVTGGRLATVTRNAYQPFASTTRFEGGNAVTIANTIGRGTAAGRLDIRFSLSVEAGFEGNHGDDIEVTVTGTGASLLPQNGNDNVIAIASVWDPITVTGVEAIEISPADFVGREQNIIHSSIGNSIVIEETRPGALAMGTELWVYVASRYGIGWPLFISRGQTISGPAGLALTVSEVRNTTIASPLGNISGAIRLTVTSQSRGEAGSVTLDGTTLFGHVYQGEVYYLVVTGPAVAANHNVVIGNVHGAFDSLPYGQPVVYEVPAVEEPTPTPTPVPTPGPRANSIAGHVFDPANLVGTPPAPEMIWYRAPGMNHQGGFVQLRAFADLVGVSDDNINWVASTRVATIAGWTWDHQWVTITMTQGSPWAQISLGTTEGARDLGTTRVDIAEFSDGLTGPTGTVVPVFQNNRIYVPFRFVFNAFGYSADYGLAREGNVARVIPN